ncbi:MAG: hypothetical protein KIT11_08440 [Fimbriimonadaceae bacterium]|nr:hypothetical protein [Fimbriimonadaceae bacterium]QYK56381.1 MAG: hypothetical protein KF733_02635 [Fimbriimonadaceae bacterium]
MATVAAALAAVSILAQSQFEAQREAVLTPPGPVQFEPWIDRGGDEFVREYDAVFPSALSTGVPVNDTVHLRLFLPTDRTGKVPVVVILHYWGATDLTLEASQARELCLTGIGAAIMTLPYHLKRAPAGTRSGELAIRPDADALVQTMTQSVLDLRRTVDFLGSRPEFDADRIGLSGTSLGAIVASLGYAVEPRIKSASFMLGGADLAAILWSSSVVVRQREEFRRKGFTEERLRQAIRAIEPLEYLRQDDPRPALVVLARYDSVVPASDGEKLARALGKPQVVELQTGHYGGALVRGKLVRLVRNFFASTLQGRDFTAPGRFYAPTLRLGVTYDTEHGLQLGAGLDVWRSNARGDAFGAAVLTTQGVQGFVGYRLGQNLALGVSILPKRVTAGAMWSVVF